MTAHGPGGGDSCRGSPVLGPLQLRGQFVLTRDARYVPSGWPARSAAGWTLGVAPDLPVLDLLAADQRQRLWLIGHPLVGDEGGSDWPAWLSGRVGAGELDDALDALGGTWCAVIFDEGGARFRLDAAGTLSAVYSPESFCVASTCTLMPAGAVSDEDTDLLESMWRSKESFLPFGLTPRRGVKRLLPNHVLDLRSFAPSRDWPPTGRSASRAAPEELVEHIVRLLVRSVQAACASQRPLMGLTGGRDSRVLLGCAGARLRDLDCFTWVLPDPIARRDLRAAIALAGLAGVSHEVVRVRVPTTEQRQRWVFKTGGAVSDERNLWMAANSEQWGRERTLIIGAGGEVGRAYYWRAGDGANSKLEVRDLIDRMGAPMHDRVIQAGLQWLQGLEGYSVRGQLDLAYIEQRMGCWAGVLAYGWADGPRRVMPFVNRQLFELMLALSEEVRARDSLAAAVLERTSPELLAFGFNRPATVRHAIAAGLARLPLLWRLARHF